MAKSEGAWQVRRVALVAGRPRYWGVEDGAASTDLRATARLLELCFSESVLGSQVRLGLDPRAVGLILRGLYCARDLVPTAAIDARFDRVGAREIAVPTLDGDEARFAGREDDLLSLLDRVEKKSDAIWLDAGEVEIWRQWLGDGLLETAELLDGRPGRQLAETNLLLRRHEFTLFAPLDPGTFAQPERWSPMGFPLNQHDLAILAACSERIKATDHRFYWSWRVANLDDEDGALAVPLLALWSDVPASRTWAPASSTGQDAGAMPGWNDEQAADILEKTLRRHVLAAIDVVGRLAGFTWGEIDFEGMLYRPPLIYLVDPRRRAARPEETLTRTDGSLHRLALRCLDTDDIFARQVAWSVLEGDFVALRREKVSVERRYFSSWHLLVPTDVKRVGDVEVEEDLSCIAEALTATDFRLNYRAHRLLRRYYVLAESQELWRQLLGEFDPVIADAIDLQPTLRKGQRRAMLAEIRELNLPLRQLVTLSETVGKQLHDLQPEFDDLVRSAEDGLVRRLDVSTLPEMNSLHDAPRQSHAFRRLELHLEAARDRTAVLAASTDRITSALTAFLDDESQRVNERLERTSRRIGPMLAILSFLLAVPQFLEFTTIKQDDQKRFFEWIDHQFGISLVSDTIELIERVFIGGLAVVALLIVAFVILWASLQSVLLDRPPAVSSAVFYFWNAVDAARRILQGTVRAGAEFESAALRDDEMRQHASDRMRWTGAMPDRPVALDPRGQRALEQFDATATEYLARIAREIVGLDRGRRRGSGYETGERLILALPLPPRVGRQRVRRWWRERRDRRRRVIDWLSRARLARYRAHFWARNPELLEFPLPRTWCVLRFKGGRLIGEARIPRGRWVASFVAAGFSPDEANWLDAWLSAPERQIEIGAMTAHDFAGVLRERGVTTVAAERTPERWRGSLREDVGSREPGVAGESWASGGPDAGELCPAVAADVPPVGTAG